MKNYPTFNNGNEDVASVDSLWHKPIINDGFNVNNTNIVQVIMVIIKHF